MKNLHFLASFIAARITAPENFWSTESTIRLGTRSGAPVQRSAGRREWSRNRGQRGSAKVPVRVFSDLGTGCAALLPACPPTRTHLPDPKDRGGDAFVSRSDTFSRRTNSPPYTRACGIPARTRVPSHCARSERETCCTRPRIHRRAPAVPG